MTAFVLGVVMPSVSVIIPAYNAEDYIDQCLDSVEKQSLTDIEIIVVDDGSSDSTVEHVESHCVLDPRIRLFKQSNQFAGVARNKGISVAKGDYLYFLDADDWIEPNALEVLTSLATDSSVDIVVARSEGFDNQNGSTWLIDYALNGIPFGTVLHVEDYADHLFQSFMGWPWDKLYKTSFVASNSLSFQPLRTTNDALFVFSSLAFAGSVYCCDQILFHHRSNNAKSLEGSRDLSWHCAIEAMDAIDQRLHSSPYYDEFKRSYCNWVMNYSFWSISTLTPSVAEKFLNALLPLVSKMPRDEEYYPQLHERLFSEYCDFNKTQLLVSLVFSKEINSDLETRNHNLECRVNNLVNELDESRTCNENLQVNLEEARNKVDDLYASHSYRLGNLVMKPIAALKRHLS